MEAGNDEHPSFDQQNLGNIRANQIRGRDESRYLDWCILSLSEARTLLILRLRANRAASKSVTD